jgi:hypothetical protein
MEEHARTALDTDGFTGDASGHPLPPPPAIAAPTAAAERAGDPDPVTATPVPAGWRMEPPREDHAAGHWPLRLGRRAAIPTILALLAVGCVVLVRVVGRGARAEARASQLAAPLVERGREAVILLRPEAQVAVATDPSRRRQLELAARRLVLVTIVAAGTAPATAEPRVRPGDLVRVPLEAGDEVVFKVAEIGHSSVIMICEEPGAPHMRVTLSLE